MNFTEELWQSSLSVYDEILRHPFIGELTNGSLARERFAFYMQQDALYLRDFSRALALTGARAPARASVRAYLEFANSAIAVEHVLHEKYLADFSITADVEKAPACFAYTQYLLATATTASYPEAVAALLPCFWIYREVGREIVQRAQQSLADNLYARWIETYAGESFNQSVIRAIDIADQVASQATSDERRAMLGAFQRSSRLEWMFWDSAYRLETWPPIFQP